MPTDIIFWVLVLGFSVILHEVAHGYMANYLGDPTARLQGRLTLNPLKHIDPFGTIIFPFILALTQSPILFGWAKPVPYNPDNIKNLHGEALVAGAGPATNILLALIFGLSMRFLGGSMSEEMLGAFAIITSINIFLAIFNLVPIPPLDGSKVLSGILPGDLKRGYDSIRSNFERMGFFAGIFIIMGLFYFLSPLFSGLLRLVFGFITGYAL